MVYTLFFIWSFISTLWRHLFSLNYHIVIIHVRFCIWGFLVPNGGSLLQVSIWLGKNCGSTCFQSQHLWLKSWKCSKRSFCLVTLLSFMNGFLEHFLTLLHGEWLGWVSSRPFSLCISLGVNGSAGWGQQRRAVPQSCLLCLAGTTAGQPTAAPLPSCPWWATSWGWGTATARTSCLTPSPGSACTWTSTAFSIRWEMPLAECALYVICM